MWREVARFEFQLQRRDFLTAVYVAVFFFLSFGYTSSSAVELVTGRGALAKNAPWALAHAMAGVTAFGQVITTMITATAVMRDVATRQQELLFATRLTRRDYLAGRWLGALLVMLVVYAAIPVGLVAGTYMPWVDAATLQPFSVGAYTRPLFVLVLPNVIVVSALFFSAGALRRSFMAILLLGVGLVTLWTTGVGLAREGSAWGTLLDPFGNAALEWATRDWSGDMRATSPIPVAGWLAGNRILWLAVGACALGWLARTYRFEVAAAVGSREPRDTTPPRPMDPRSAPVAARSWRHRAERRVAARPSPRHAARALLLEAGWTLRWTLRERGFVTLAALGALNALANSWRAGGAEPTAGDVLGSVQAHARIFLILVATIYAGELVWRERDVRIDALQDALPVGTGTMVAGRIAGIIGALALLVLPLLLVALIVGFARSASGMSPGLAAWWVGGLVLPFVVQLTLLSLLVHAVVQHKVAGHVILIGGWVLAVAMERSLALPRWVRFANLPPYEWTVASGFGGAGGAMAWWVGYWSAVAAACGILATSGWVRGFAPGGAERLALGIRRLQGPTGALLLLALSASAVCGWQAMHDRAPAPPRAASVGSPSRLLVF